MKVSMYINQDTQILILADSLVNSYYNKHIYLAKTDKALFFLWNSVTQYLTYFVTLELIG